MPGASDYNRWGAVGVNYANRPKDGPAGDEIRWGDTSLFDVPIPAGGIVGLTVVPGKQLIQAERPARVWNLSFFSAFTPPFVGGDDWEVFWRVTIGVGNSTLKRYVSVATSDYIQLIGAVFPGDVPAAQESLLNVAGGQLVVDTALLIHSAAATGSPRRLVMTSAAQVAPIER